MFVRCFRHEVHYVYDNHHLGFALCRSERARWITVLGQDRDRQSTDRTSKFSYQQQWALWCGTGNALPLSGAFSTWMLYPCFSWALLLQYMWSCHPFLAHRHFFKFCFALWFLFVHQCLVSCSSLLTEEHSPVPCVQSVCCVVGKPLSAAFGFWFFGVGRTF